MLRSVIIGCGQIAGNYDAVLPQGVTTLTHAGAYRLSQQVKLVGVVDQDLERAKAFAERWSVESFSDNAEELITDLKPDLVSICTPVSSHLMLAELCQRFNVRGILCEKPLASSITEARRFESLAKEMTIALNFFRRFNRDLSDLSQKISAQKWGERRCSVVRYTKGFLGNGSHVLDLMRWFFGEPVSWQVLQKNVLPDGDYGLSCVYYFQDGFSCIMQHVPNVDYVFIDMDILFASGRVVIAQRGQEIQMYQVAQDTSYPFSIVVPHEVIKTSWNECLPGAVANLVDAVTKAQAPQCGVREGIRVMEIAKDTLENNTGSWL